MPPTQALTPKTKTLIFSSTVSTTNNFSKRMAICLKTLISSSTASTVDVEAAVDAAAATAVDAATATRTTTPTALSTPASLTRVSYISCYGFLLESISCVLFTNFTSLYYYQHIVFPYCCRKVVVDAVVVMVIPAKSAARTTVPIVAVPVAMIHALGAILINQ